jgi:hypothetical protein
LQNGVAGAQVPARDTARAPLDTTVAARGDSAAGRPVPRDTARQLTEQDTVKAPIARAELPVVAEAVPRYPGTTLLYDRAALFASGALTLADLLERVPGLTTYRGRWMTAPMVGAYMGDVGAVRLFVDGLELDQLDARTGGVVDLSAVQLWPMEEVAIERGASELRIHMRTWRQRRTTAHTRVDVSTGDEDTNIYRGFYGKRFSHGEALQIAAQQFSTQVRRSGIGGDGDALSLLARVGIARDRWSADAFVNRTRRTRSELTPLSFAGVPALPGLDATDVYAYVRAAYGDPEGGLWAQALAGSLAFSEVGFRVDSSAATEERPLNVVDTAVSRAQYVGAAGLTVGGLRLSATNRVRVFSGRTDYSPSGRIAFDRSRLSLSLFAERSSLDERTRLEALFRFLPLSFLSLSGAVSQTGAGGELTVPTAEGGTTQVGIPSSRAARGEVAARIGGLWLGGGVLARDSTVLAAPLVFNGSYVPVLEGRLSGAFATVRGRLFKDVFADATGVRWDVGDSYYRPQFQSWARLYLATEWRSRFPSGNFGALVSALHEYRSNALFLRADGATLQAPQSRVISTLLEIRIVNATLTWQFRNVLGERYETVPGFEMPRPTSVYGVRWDFWN